MIGCKYPGIDLEALLEFETHVIQVQMDVEKAFIGIAGANDRDYKGTVIIMDRGVRSHL